MNDDAAEAEQGDEVRYRHEGVHAVGDVPYQTEIDHATNEDGDDIDDAEGNHPFLSSKIFYATLAIVTPTQRGAEGESGEAEGEQWGSDIWNLAECLLCESRSIMIVDVWVGYDARGDDHSGEGANDDCIPGLRVWAAAATIGAEPRPDSLENRPRAIP